MMNYFVVVDKFVFLKDVPWSWSIVAGDQSGIEADCLDLVIRIGCFEFPAMNVVVVFVDVSYGVSVVGFGQQSRQII